MSDVPFNIDDIHRLSKAAAKHERRFKQEIDKQVRCWDNAITFEEWVIRKLAGFAARLEDIEVRRSKERGVKVDESTREDEIARAWVCSTCEHHWHASQANGCPTCGADYVELEDLKARKERT